MKDRLEQISRRFDVRWQFFHRIKDSPKILELGCGSGINYESLRELNPHLIYYGVDLLPVEEIPADIEYTHLDLDKNLLPYESESFDAVLFTHVIEHLRNPLAVGAEIHRVLKPGAIIYMETPNWTSTLVPSLGFYRKQSNPFNFFDDHTHLRPYTKQSVYNFLNEVCKLRVESVATVRNWPRIPWDIFKFVHGLIVGNRQRMVTSFWNIYGWCIYGIAVKR